MILASFIVGIFAIIALLVYNWWHDSSGQVRLAKSLIDKELELFASFYGQFNPDMVRRFYDERELMMRFGVYATFERGPTEIGITRIFNKDGHNITKELEKEYKRQVDLYVQQYGYGDVR